MWTGLILAGGRSARMGRDKARIAIGGRSLLERAVDLVRASGGDPVLVGPPRVDLPLAGVPRLDETEDGTPPAGPLAALCHGLAATGADRVVALGCDQPLLTPGLLKMLVRHSESYDAVVPRAAGELQVLAAAYTRACLPAMEELLAAGRRALHDLVPRVRARLLEAADLQSCGGPGIFLNVNTPEDLARAEAALAGTER